MTIEQTRAAIAVMQAYVDGKEIEFRPNKASDWPWRNASIPLWDWTTYEFRIKHTPIEGWVNVFPKMFLLTYASQKEAIGNAGPSCIKTIKVREVEE